VDHVPELGNFHCYCHCLGDHSPLHPEKVLLIAKGTAYFFASTMITSRMVSLWMAQK
jgi:hypothetical protein